MASRKRRDKDLPPNLYRHSGGYYQYRRPTDGRRFGLGKDKAYAVRQAREANFKLDYGIRPDVVDRLATGGVRFGELASRFMEERAGGLYSTPASMSNVRGYIKRHVALWESKEVDGFTVTDIAAFLDTLGPEAYKTQRSVLKRIFEFALSKGMRADNPVLNTLPTLNRPGVDDEGKVRDRLTLEEYRAIYSAAPDWFQDYMEVLLVTLLRPSDVVRIRPEMIKDGTLYIVVGKKKKKEKPVPLAISVSPDIETRMRRLRHRARSTLTHDFAGIRDSLPLFRDSGRDRKTLPSLYEIKSLGVFLYEEKLQKPREYTQSLIGHKSSQMTEVYAEGHQTKWQHVAADLTLGDL